MPEIIESTGILHGISAWGSLTFFQKISKIGINFKEGGLELISNNPFKSSLVFIILISYLSLSSCASISKKQSCLTILHSKKELKNSTTLSLTEYSKKIGYTQRISKNSFIVHPKCFADPESIDSIIIRFYNIYCKNNNGQVEIKHLIEPFHKKLVENIQKLPYPKFYKKIIRPLGDECVAGYSISTKTLLRKLAGTYEHSDYSISTTCYIPNKKQVFIVVRNDFNNKYFIIHQYNLNQVASKLKKINREIIKKIKQSIEYSIASDNQTTVYYTFIRNSPTPYLRIITLIYGSSFPGWWEVEINVENPSSKPQKFDINRFGIIRRNTIYKNGNFQKRWVPVLIPKNPDNFSIITSGKCKATSATSAIIQPKGSCKIFLGKWKKIYDLNNSFILYRGTIYPLKKTTAFELIKENLF